MSATFPRYCAFRSETFSYLLSIFHQIQRRRSATSTSTKRLVAFAKKHEIWLLSDLAYAEIYYDGNPPPSILQAPGAKDVAVEFTSLSKTYSMPGWRMASRRATERLIGALTRIKSYLDYRRLYACSGRCKHPP